jgi:hypothetical protein
VKPWYTTEVNEAMHRKATTMANIEITVRVTHIEIALSNGRYTMFEASKVAVVFVDGVAMARNPENTWEFYGRALAARMSDGNFRKFF